MPFVPHTQADVETMLAEIGAPNIEALFDEIPAHLASGQLDHVPQGKSELALLQYMQQRANQDDGYVCFMGGGSYDHHIPAAVWDITARGEFMTAYTPYQAEASQGTLQLIYEYQSMMAALTGMDVSNASVYDGASGLAEAILMALRGNKKNKSRRVLVAASVHPHYSKTSQNIVKNQGVELITLALGADGIVVPEELSSMQPAPAALVIQQPNFFGCLEQVDALTDWAHEQQALVIAVVNPMTLALLKPPGEWGECGADIVCGDGQPLGVPMASGGPSFGFLCARQKLMRQMPGRIIGRTQDVDGKQGYTLTLQAREQHIRRGKATSNICTNQGLLVTAGTIYLSLMGPQGLADVAHASLQNARNLREKLLCLPGVTALFTAVTFHEFAIKLPIHARKVIAHMCEQGILAGLCLADFVKETASDVGLAQVDDLDYGLLVAVTEKRTDEEIAAYVNALQAAISATQEVEL
ncbi:MAG: aminomethyl-transferring glycine dehydrogenase subunit GcvPA [Gammaproteobacteria bacterium]|nr:aminomethyl-transferring glycine dehydrogenase subunit GcvPA [Gammaproteobacteria bacterium]